jgi:hypothetical protein
MGNSLRVAGAAAVSLLAIVATGCGATTSPSASSATTSTTATTPGAGANTAGRAAFDACLAQHGVKLPPRPAGGGGGNGQPPAGGGGGGGGLANLTAAQRQAFTACRSKLPAGAGPRGGGGRANNPAFAKYNTCLKQHGVTLGKSNDPATFAKAQTACAKLAPVPGGSTTQ